MPIIRLIINISLTVQDNTSENSLAVDIIATIGCQLLPYRDRLLL